MRVLNEHSRVVPSSPGSVGELLDTLASKRDLLWPHLTWPLVFRPLHDTLLEDALDRAQATLSGDEWVKRGWPLSVRALRRMLARS